MKKFATIISLFYIVILPISAQMTGDFDSNNNNTVNCTTFSYNMRKGDRDSNTGGEVSKLQELLGQMGYMYQDPTGFFGNTTFQAVKSFQSANNLSATGYVGTLTRDALRARSCNTPLNNNNNNNTVCAINTTYTSSSCVCPAGYYAHYPVVGSGAFSCQSNYGNNNSNICSLNTVYSSNTCSCPSGYVVTSYGIGTFMCQLQTPQVNNYNNVCNINTTYTYNACTCPSGYYANYNSYNNNTFVCQNYINNNTNNDSCYYYGSCNNTWNNVCAVGENVQVDLSRCTCPTGYTAQYYQTFAYDGTRPGICRYTGWYGY